MRVVVVYESMFGNTHVVADHVGAGLREQHDTLVVPIREALELPIDDVDLVVVGAPTHAHGLTSAASRRSARDTAADDDTLDLDGAAAGPGVREWLKHIEGGNRLAAAFDTRIDAPAAFTGRAAKGIARRLRTHGFRLMTEPESFLVDKQHHLIHGEAARATAWGGQLASTLAEAMSSR